MTHTPEEVQPDRDIGRALPGMEDPAERPASGRLTSAEMALAAVMAGLTVVVTAFGSLVPHAGAVGMLGAVPQGLVAQRFRFRALATSAFAASLVGFFVAGPGPVLMVAACATVGWVVGTLKRHRRKAGSVVLAAAVLAPVLAALADGTLLVFAFLRRLALAQVKIFASGASGILRHIGLGSIAGWIDHALGMMTRDWWIVVAVLVATGVVVAIAMVWLVLGAVLARLEWVSTADRFASASLSGLSGHEPVAPLPISLHGVSYRYPGATRDALRNVDLEVGVGEFVAVVGDNGSGKSTLARIIGGVTPTEGDVRRPGAIGLGAMGGVAVVAQRPESQILGARVDDDVSWGLHGADRPDVGSLLSLVGLAGMDERETSTLSGGELQRLAVAAALAHHPTLLISDESTAMIDLHGSRSLMAILTGLPQQFPMSVVHVTHREGEANAADQLVHLEHGRQIVATPRTPAAAARTEESTPRLGSKEDQLAAEKASSRQRDGDRPTPVLRAKGLGHTYAAGTPWERPALHEIDLALGDGEGLLVVGGNGSGKSTLAWSLAGLLRPTAGTCELDGAPVVDQVGLVALAFQHARLQLQRPQVLADVMAASGADRTAAEMALETVGLDPERFATRPVEELSGGQLRRAALAGLLARQPRVLILDEPLAGLDGASRESLLELLLRLRRDEGRTLVVISHDLEGLGEVCPRTIELVAGHVASETSR